jgi:hypothetical protein
MSDKETEEVIEKPKPKRVMSEKQKEVFAKAQAARMRNIQIKKEEKEQNKVATKLGTCTSVSDSRLIMVTAIEEASVKEIGLRISSDDYIENMIKGSSFYVQFSNIQTEGITLDIMNSMGSNVFHKENLINQRSPQKIFINNLTTGVYFVKIYANKKVYVQRVFVTNN